MTSFSVAQDLLIKDRAFCIRFIVNNFKKTGTSIRSILHCRDPSFSAELIIDILDSSIVFIDQILSFDLIDILHGG